MQQATCLRGLWGLCVLGIVASADAAPPARTLYAAALAREQAVRSVLAAADPDRGLLAEVRAVIADYESLVRRYPTSGYSDNALWQAGRLSLDAYARFGQPQDRDKGVRLLRKLAAVYDTSKLAKQVPEEIAHIAGSAEQARSRPAVPPLVGAAPAPPSPARADPAPPSTTARVANLGKPLATIKAIRRSLLRDAVRVTIELDAEVPFHDERLDDPARVFVDLSNTRAAPRLIDRTIRFDGDADLVRQIRVGRHPNKTTRVVLDAAHVASYSVYPLYDPYRLVIDCVRKTDGRLTASAEASPFDGAQGVPSDRRGAAIEKPDATNGTTSAHQPTPVASAFSRTGPLPARSLIGLLIRRPPAVIPRATAAIADARSDEVPLKPDTTDVTLKPEPTADASPARPAPNPGRGFSMARQLGLGVSRIVIDAGHGGHDPGAQGRGITEAELVLDVALRLEALLERAPGVEVILTRRSDEFIALQERTAIANREGADLFLSIHANASRSPQARGVETYFLNFASNLSAASVAARENAASGHAMGALPDLVKAIALNNKLDESRDFAAQIQRAMLERLRGANRTVKDLGVKQAPFVVLIGAAMPSVLAEISFVTNPQEARLLKSGAYRQRIAEALFNAIRKYQSSLKSAVAVAHQ